jgi:hypothetical protein
MVGGNLVINNPDKQKDAGTYYCLASNNYGMVRSTEAILSFGCKQVQLFLRGKFILVKGKLGIF